MRWPDCISQPGQIGQLADGPAHRDRIGFGETKWPGAIWVFVVGRGGLQHCLHYRMGKFQLELPIIQDAVNVRHCFAQRLVFFVATEQVGQESHECCFAEYVVELLQQFAQTAQSRFLEAHADGLFQEVSVRAVDVGNTGVDLLVVLGTDAKRTVGAPHMDAIP